MENPAQDQETEGRSVTNREVERILEVGRILLSVLTPDELDQILSGSDADQDKRISFPQVGKDTWPSE